MFTKDTLLAHLLSRTIRQENGCLIWQGHVDEYGYGQVRTQAVVETGFVYWRVHRLVFYLRAGFVPDKVLHTCDMPSCIEYEHFFNGTQLDNVRDAKAKGRLRRGEDNHAKLTLRDVHTLRRFFARFEGRRLPYGMLPRLASGFHVSIETIQQMRYGRSWVGL